MPESPAFQFYPDDWLGSTKIALMTPSEEGAYIRLLCHAWNSVDCGLPDDDRMLAVLSRLGMKRWRKTKGSILSCFFKNDGRWFNKRLLDERGKQLKYHESKSSAGKIGASVRWQSHSSAIGLPMANDSSSSSLSSPSSSPTAREEKSDMPFLLMRRAQEAKIPNNPETIVRYLTAWTARSSQGKVEQVLMDPWSQGKTVLEIQDRFFAKENGEASHLVGLVSRQATKPANPHCNSCHGSGNVLSGEGRKVMCRCRW